MYGLMRLAGAIAAMLLIAPGCQSAPPPLPTGTPPAASGALAGLKAMPVGTLPLADEQPQITHVTIADLDRDGLNDILVCDALKNQLAWIRQEPRGTFTEQRITGVAAPAYVQAIDFDGDNDIDLLVAALGFLFPNNNRVGSVILLENEGQQTFRAHYVADRVARVADARAADLDGDGDLDISVAGRGGEDGETSWLENRGAWQFEQHVLQRQAGGLNAVPVDINGDTRPDIVTLVGKEFDEIWAFLSHGPGGFTPALLWEATEPDFGSNRLSMADMDRDGDADILLANGGTVGSAPAASRPGQGVQWLENVGPVVPDGPPRFTLHRIADLHGASSPEAADLDGDGDIDVLLVTANNNWDDPAVRSLLWLENDGRMQFALRGIGGAPTHLQTVAIGDLDGDGRPDAATGGMHIGRPSDRIGRITAWLSGGRD